MTLPDWIPQEAWDGFLEMRKGIKKPLTERGKGMAVRKLDDLRSQGYEPGMVLDQSTFMCWAGLFPLKGERDGDGASRKTFDAIRREASAGAIKRTLGAYKQVGGNLFRAPSPGNKRIGDGGIH